MNRLYIEDTEGNVRVVPIDSDEMSIGRAEDNDLVLAGRNVSRHHARITRDGSDMLVDDAGARYGLKVNGIVVSENKVIEPGDVIELGDYKLKILTRDAAVADETLSSETPTVDVSPERRETVPDQAAVAQEPAPSEAPTSVNVIREMEDLAASSGDWGADLALDEQEVSGHGVSGGKGLVLAGLVILALALGLVYYWVSGETPTPTAPTSQKPVIAAIPEPRPVKKAEPVPVTAVDEPAPVEAVPAVENAASPLEPEDPVVVPEKPLKPVEKIAIKKPAPRPKPAPKPTPRPTAKKPAVKKPAPKKKAGGNYDEIDKAIKDFKAAEAERLLKGCKGSGCFRRWKKVAKMYEGFGEPGKAIRVYRRLIGMTRDPTSKERFRKRIIALGGSPE